MRLFKRRNKHGQYVWYVDYFFEGKWFQRKASVDRKEAEDILAGIRMKINEDTFKVPIKRRDKPENRCRIHTFDDLAKEVFETFIKSNTAQPEKYRSRINTIGKFFAGKKLADITSFTIEQYKKRRKEGGASVATLNRDLACLSVMFHKPWNGRL